MEPIDPPGVGVVQSRPESFRVVRSRPESESSGVVRSRSESSESSVVVRNRSWSESTGVVWFNVLVIRHFLSLCFLSFSLRAHFLYKPISADSRWLRMTPSAADSGWLQTTPDDFERLRMIPNDSERLQKTPDDSERLRTTPTSSASGPFRTIPNDSGYCSTDRPSGVDSEFIGVGSGSTPDFCHLYPWLVYSQLQNFGAYLSL